VRAFVTDHPARSKGLSQGQWPYGRICISHRSCPSTPCIPGVTRFPGVSIRAFSTAWKTVNGTNCRRAYSLLI